MVGLFSNPVGQEAKTIYRGGVGRRVHLSKLIGLVHSQLCENDGNQ